MSLAGYREYRDSGVEWLGAIPAHWVVYALKRDARVQGGYAFKSDDFGEEGAPVVRIGDINLNGNVGVDACKRVPEPIASPLGMFVVAPGDIVMAMTGATIGKAGKIPEGEPALLNQRVCAFKLVSEQFEYGFLWFVLGSEEYLEHVRLTAEGGAQPNISDTGMLAYQLAVPPLEEQTQIAKFLDYETAKIDALIEKQQQLIVLLKEKRQAVISHAATKGVEAGALLKDSGINWMGSVPAHWKILPVKRLFDVSYGLMGEIDRSLKSGTQVISLPNVLKDGTLDLRGTSFRVLTAEERKAAALKKGDLLFNWRNGSIDHVGKTALFDHDGDYAHVSFLLKLRALSRDVVPEFYWLALNGLRASGFFGSSKLQVNVTYNQSELRRVPLPVPPVDEQRRIVDVVLKRYKAIDAAGELVERGLELLQERRTALISAAVTGKIDVRGWKHPESKSEPEVA